MLVGEEGSHDCMLASPIILYDYPQVAAESAGDLFDGTEIDEILALRVLTLTEDEKREARDVGRARAADSRPDRRPDPGALGEAARDGARTAESAGAAPMNEWEWRLLEERTQVNRVPDAGGELTRAPGCGCVRAGGGDAMDLLLAGRTAVIEAIEQDYEGTFHVALVFDDDPGRDLRLLRQPGHRFFYAPDGGRTAGGSDAAASRAGDDRATLSVAGGRRMPRAAAVVDSGCRDRQHLPRRRRVRRRGRATAGARRCRRACASSTTGSASLDLAYALMDAPDVTILVDACSRGEAPGTLFVIEPDLESAAGTEPAAWTRMR